ncbi:hypothetical protein RUM43_004241 [Polyplax serrata]|uniref:Sushi domain-containing protein n=1 Tax=Polyplax serrata TaxID=468196 RepID=A0AAN8SBS8_POLSC
MKTLHLLILFVSARILAASAYQDFKDRHFMERNLMDKYDRRLTSQVVTHPESNRISPKPYFRERNDTGERHHMSSGENKETDKVRVIKTQGRGMMEIRRGETVNIPNSLTQKETMRMSDNSKVLTDRARYKMKKNGRALGMRKHRNACKRLCPPNRKVVAPKGQNFVILPHPCPPNSKWNQLSGPQPGDMIHEGTHLVTGTMGMNNKHCQYQYEVSVRSCEYLKPFQNGTRIKCSNGNTWGSNCTVFCGKGRKAEGPTTMECQDDLTWSNPIPKCKSENIQIFLQTFKQLNKNIVALTPGVRTCSMPKIKSNSRIWCQTANLIPTRGDSIPEGSSCRFYKNGKIIAITCKKGIWRGIRKIKQTH